MAFLAVLKNLVILGLALLAVNVLCYSTGPGVISVVRSHQKQISGSSTALHAHHVMKKITKRMMHRRPKKSRPSDITRSNTNLNKCITKVDGAPAEYTLMSAEDYMKVREEALKFWDEGDPSAEWLEILEEDMVATFSQNREPLPVGGVQKVPPLVRSGSA